MKIIGFGLDNQDGHQRMTEADAYRLFDGSEKSHEEMQALCALLEETLQQRGSSLAQASRAEVESLVRELSDPDREGDKSDT